MFLSILRRPLWASLLIAACLLVLGGCSPEGAGSIDLKKTTSQPQSGAPKPREFRAGDLEER